jgi:hypothetical protein
VALALLVFAAGRGARRGILRGALLAAAAIAVGALAGAALVGGIELARGEAEPWAGHPLPATAALVAGAAAGLAALARAPFFSRAGFAATWAGAWLLLALAGLAAAVLAPGVTALLLPPVLAAGLAGFLRRPLLRAAVPLLVLAALWIPLAAGLAAVAELRAPAVLGAVVGVVLAAATPALRLLGTRDLARCARLAAGTAAIAAVAALLVPSHTVDRPAWLNLVHLEDADAGTARVLANAFGGPLPDALARAADFSEAPESPLPGLSGLAAAAEASPASPPSVEVRSEVVEDGARTIELHLRSTRGARGLVVSARELEAPDEHDSGVLRAAWNGHAIDRPRPRVGAVRGTRASGTWVFLGTGAEGIDLRLRAPKDERVELSVIDFASGLPETCRELARARPATSVPRGEGDLSLVARRIEL